MFKVIKFIVNFACMALGVYVLFLSCLLAVETGRTGEDIHAVLAIFCLIVYICSLLVVRNILQKQEAIWWQKVPFKYQSRY